MAQASGKGWAPLYDALHGDDAAAVLRTLAQAAAAAKGAGVASDSMQAAALEQAHGDLYAVACECYANPVRYIKAAAQAYPYVIRAGGLYAVEGGVVGGWVAYVVAMGGNRWAAVYGDAAQGKPLHVDTFTGSEGGARDAAWARYRDNRTRAGFIAKQGVHVQSSVEAMAYASNNNGAAHRANRESGLVAVAVGMRTVRVDYTNATV